MQDHMEPHIGILHYIQQVTNRIKRKRKATKSQGGKNETEQNVSEISQDKHSEKHLSNPCT